MKKIILSIVFIFASQQAMAKPFQTIGQNAKKIITLLLENGVQENIFEPSKEVVIKWTKNRVSCLSRSNSAVDPENRFFMIANVTCDNLALNRTSARELIKILGDLPHQYFVGCALGGLCSTGELDIECQIDTRKHSDFRFSCTIERS